MVTAIPHADSFLYQAAVDLSATAGDIAAALAEGRSCPGTAARVLDLAQALAAELCPGTIDDARDAGAAARAERREQHAAGELLEAAAAVTRHAARFARIDRSVVTLPDGTAESDSDHTVHLAWLASALASATEPGLDPVLVAAYAVVHDAVEVFADDTPTITITDRERARKHEREQAALLAWHDDLGERLPWLPAMIGRYELQADAEARFVKAADKVAPKLVHHRNSARDLHAAGVTPGQFRDMVREQRASLGTYAEEFAGLLSIYDQVTAAVDRALTGLAGRRPS
ncbi:MAG: HD domain-containing protein [Streptosporangiales bacterium]|nr:HD domain-containing protein [Streptosporangiales bacterium]